VTYIQCMISKILLKRLPEKIQVTSLFGNDDSCLKIWAEDNDLDEFDCLLIQTEDFDILRGLNIITNDKKSFWSWYPILFEEYGHQDFRIKHSRIACALSSAMLAPDIKYAKFLTSSVSMALWDNGDWITEPLKELTLKWGYEYYPSEVQFDYTLGGWISIRSTGLNPALRMIENAPDELIQPMWVAMNHINQFQKEVISPVLKGTVTKNYSIIGQLFNITYVDIDIYDIPCLPVTGLFQNREGFKKFYESIYKFNRTPYKEMARRLRHVMSVKPGRATDRHTLMDFMIRNFNKLAIPKTMVLSETHVYEIRKGTNIDCFSLMRNCLSRFIQYLKDELIIMCPDQEVPGSGEYPYIESYDRTPYTEEVYEVVDLDGNIPEGIFQFSTNPWLPLYEYVKEFETFPVSLSRFTEDRIHLPIWFMNKQYRDSLEVSVAWGLYPYGETVVNQIIEDIRLRDIINKPPPEKKFREVVLCDLCQAGYSGWDMNNDIYNPFDAECEMCMLQDDLWRTRKLSQVADSVEKRSEEMRRIPRLTTEIKDLVDRYLPTLKEFIPRFLQGTSSANMFLGTQVSDEEDVLGDMFG
jgi:hypothetical protein